jgi:CheY-like chemotaxis protein
VNVASGNPLGLNSTEHHKEKTMKALLVDDSKAARFAMGKLLKDQGLEVEMAASGEEALDKIATEAINIVFMDQSMPGMGGIAATRAITSNEKTAHIPVVLCTGNEGEKLEQMAEEAGAIGVLTKPPREEALKQVLSSVSVDEIIPAIEEMEETAAETTSMDREALMAEVNALVEQLRQQVAETEQSLQDQIKAAARAAKQDMQPLHAALSGMDTQIKEKVKEQLSVDSNNQRIQLEALRQQVNAGLDEMEERERRMRDTIMREVQQQVLKLVDRKLAPLKENVEEFTTATFGKLESLEERLDKMEQGLLGKSALIAILAAGAAFAAAYFLI